MKSKTRKAITVETRRKTVIRRNAPAIFAWCEACGIETRMLAPEEFARVQGTTARLVYRQIESGDFHFVETQTGTSLICRGSLTEKTKIRR